MGDRILVTGETGFTGYALCEKLSSEGMRVVAFVRESSNTTKLEQLGVEVKRLDMLNADAVDAAFESFSVVYHIAAAFRTEHDHIDEFRKANVEMTRVLMDASLKHQCGRFVHCSTVGVQGEILDPPAAEDYRYGPGDHYQETKMEGELLVLSYMQEKGLPGAIVRPVGIYGPGDFRFLKLFQPIARKKFVMIGSGEVLYQLTYIDDLIQGFLLAGTHPQALGEIFTIGGEQYSTLNELVDEIARQTGGGRALPFHIPYLPVYMASVVCAWLCKLLNVSPPLFPRRVEFFKKPRAFSIEKAKKRLGYAPSVSLEKGIQLTYKWYKEQGLI